MNKDEQEEIQANTLKAQERDLFCFQDTLARYESMVAKMINNDPLTADLKAKLETEIPVLRSRIAEVTAIIESIKERITDEAVVAAHGRLEAKMAAKQA